MAARILVLCCLLCWSLTVPAQSPAQTPGDDMVSHRSEDLPDRPLRIVSLEAITTEMLLALGVVPVGVGGLDAYRRQGKPRAELLHDSVGLGSDQQPNLERLILLQPDLVVSTVSLHGGLFDRLDSLAPTLLYDVSLAPERGDAVEQIAAILRHLAVLTDRQPEAEQVLDRLSGAIARGRQAAADAGISGQPLAVLYPLPAQGLFIVSNENTLVVSLANRLGGTNPWPLNDSRTINRRIELHKVARQPDLHLFLIGGFQGAAMFGSRLWQSLPVARNERWGFLQTVYWSFGGPLTAEVILEQMVDVIRAMGTGHPEHPG